MQLVACRPWITREIWTHVAMWVQSGPEKIDMKKYMHVCAFQDSRKLSCTSCIISNFKAHGLVSQHYYVCVIDIAIWFHYKAVWHSGLQESYEYLQPPILMQITGAKIFFSKKKPSSLQERLSIYIAHVQSSVSLQQTITSFHIHTAEVYTNTGQKKHGVYIGCLPILHEFRLNHSTYHHQLDSHARCAQKVPVHQIFSRP
jgi:hypothetical protein